MNANTETTSRSYEPEQTDASAAYWCWFRANLPSDPASLPPELFDRLSSASGAANYRSYTSRAEALADLEQAQARR